MFYAVPLGVIIFSLVGIFYIVFRKGRSIRKEDGDVSIYPMSESKKDDSLAYPDMNESGNRPERSDLIKKFAGEAASVQPEKKGGGKKLIVAKLIKLAMRSAVFIKEKAVKVANFTLAVLKKLKKVKEEKNDLQPLLSDEDINKPEQPQDKEVPSSASVASVGILAGKEPDAKVSSPNIEDSEVDEQYWIDVLKHDPKSPFPYKRLGEIYVARGDFKEARATFKYALRLDPRDGEIVQKLEELRGKRTKRV